MRNRGVWLARAAVVLPLACVCALVYAQVPWATKVPHFPWSNPTLSPDQRADMVMLRMTLAEKLQMVHGPAYRGFVPVTPSAWRSRGGAGFVPGIPRLGIPDLNFSDSAVGVANTAGEGRYATALPSALALASSWNERLAFEYGSLIGSELADFGFNVSLGGGVNLARDPRDGRNFEFFGEDPILAGNLDARVIEGIQSHHIIGDVKHFAMNDQETGRMYANSVIGKRDMRETDLLAFQIATKQAHPGMVMCAYNLVNGVYSCQDHYLLDDVLKRDWGFKGWVISDWFATHSTLRASNAGLDMEMPDDRYFGAALARAVASGRVSMVRLNDMVHRILRTEFASGIIDHPPQPEAPDISRGEKVAKHVEEESAVLLKNSGLLPLESAKIRSIAVIGSHADVGVMSGGGSAQVSPPGGGPVKGKGPPHTLDEYLRTAVWDPSSPLKAIQAEAPAARVTYDPGTEIASAAHAAKLAQVAIVFVTQHMSEGIDATTIRLPGNQDALVAAVAAANPDTIVVLETGGPVAMPWAHKVAGILEAWYPGIQGGQAIANLLFGVVNPSAKLVVTFPQSDSQLPRPVIPAPAGGPPTMQQMLKGDVRPFNVRYTEGLEVGYKWFDAQGEHPLFPFGYGLSYSSFVYSSLAAGVTAHTLDLSFMVRNTSGRAGTEIAEVYLTSPEQTGEPPKRLIGWVRVDLQPHANRAVSLRIEPLYFSVYNALAGNWRIVPGRYTVLVGSSSRDLPLSAGLRLH